LDVQRPRYAWIGGERVMNWGGVPRGNHGCPLGLRRLVTDRCDDVEDSDCYECPRANRYWARVLTPTLEFGLMHAIMLQMGALPLTMSHYTLKSLSEIDVVQRFLPMHRVQRLHVNIGYFITIMLTLAVGGFLTFFGTLCRDSREGGSHFKPPDFKNENDCVKFESEIFLTGIVIFGMTLLIAGTAIFRSRLPYWVFICSHQLVFVWFAVAIAHTVDDQQRTNHGEPRKSDSANERKTLKRSQVWPWCLGSLAWYWLDRTYLSTQHRFQAQIIKAVLRETPGRRSKSIELHVQKPPALQGWRPGEHFLLRDPRISPIFHPFSCCGAMHDDLVLKFLVKVQESSRTWRKRTWTEALYDRLYTMAQTFKKEEAGLFRLEQKIEVVPRGAVDGAVTLQGPYGTPPDFSADFDHVILIGSGSGAVPCLAIVDDIASRLVAQSAILCTTKNVVVVPDDENNDNTLKLHRSSSSSFNTKGERGLRRRASLQKSIETHESPALLYWSLVKALGISLLLLGQFLIGGLEVSWYVLGVRMENTYLKRHGLFLRPLWKCGVALQLSFLAVVFTDLQSKLKKKKKIFFSDFLDVALFVAGAAAEGRWAVWRSNGGRGPWRRGAPDAAGRAVLAAARFLRLWARNALVQNAPKKAGHSLEAGNNNNKINHLSSQGATSSSSSSSRATTALSPVRSLDAIILSPDTKSAEWLLPSAAAAQLTTAANLKDAGHSADFSIDVYLTRATNIAETYEDCAGALRESNDIFMDAANALTDSDGAAASFLENHVTCGFPDIMRLVHDRMVSNVGRKTSRTCIFFCGPATLGEQIQDIVYRANFLFGDDDHTVLYYDDVYAQDTPQAKKRALERGTLHERAAAGAHKLKSPPAAGCTDSFAAPDDDDDQDPRNSIHPQEKIIAANKDFQY